MVIMRKREKKKKEKVSCCSKIIAVPLFWGFSVQFNSVAQLCRTLCDPVNRSMPGLPVHHQLPEFTQSHVHRVGDFSWPEKKQDSFVM